MLLPRLLERVRAHAQAALRLHWRARRAAMLLSVASSEGCRVEGGGLGRGDRGKRGATITRASLAAGTKN